MVAFLVQQKLAFFTKRVSIAIKARLVVFQLYFFKQIKGEALKTLNEIFKFSLPFWFNIFKLSRLKILVKELFV